MKDIGYKGYVGKHTQVGPLKFWTVYSPIGKKVGETDTILVTEFREFVEEYIDKETADTFDFDSVVYFIRCNSYIKIGITQAFKLKYRVAELQIGNPHKLEVIGRLSFRTKEQAYAKEVELHKKFDNLWERGEWFNLGAELVEYLETLGVHIDGKQTTLSAVEGRSIQEQSGRPENEFLTAVDV